MARAKYEEWLEEANLTRIESWASDGLTNEQIASNMGVTRQTLGDWCNKHASILGALKKGREPVVREIENALIRNAKGFEYEETTTEFWVDEQGNKRQKMLKHKRYSKPDSSAAMFLLKNYKPEKYRNYTELTKDKMRAEIAKLEAEAKKTMQEVEASTVDDVIYIVDDISEVDIDVYSEAEH